MTDQEKEKFEKLLNTNLITYSRTSRRWKLGYRVFLVLSALLSAGAAVVSKLNFIGNPELAADISSILAGLATIVITIVASLNFQNFWRANQNAREKIRILELDMYKPKFTFDEGLEKLKEIVKERDERLSKGD